MINCVLNQFNSFDKNLNFTIGTFKNSVPNFLDIKICPNGLGIYHKHTQTGQYVHITSYTLWRWKTLWIRSLVIRAKKICSANYFNIEIQLIKRSAAWNGYPRNVVNGIIKHTLRNNNNNNDNNNNNNNNNNMFNDNEIDNAVRIFIKIKYCGETTDRLIKRCMISFTSVSRKKRELNLFYNTKKLNYLTLTMYEKALQVFQERKEG